MRGFHTGSLLRQSATERESESGDSEAPPALPLLPREIDPFAVLGLDQKCTLEDARKAYYRLALKYHPDTTKEDPERAGLMFQRVGEAYRILSERPEFLSDSADTSSKSQVRLEIFLLWKEKKVQWLPLLLL